MSGILPKIVLPDDVRAYRGRIDAFARAIDRSVAQCSALDPFARRSWAEFYARWQEFCATEVSWLHTAAQYEETERYEEHLLRWQAYLAPMCRSAGPPMTRPGGAISASSTEGTIKTVAIAGAVIATALAIRAVTR